MPAKGSHFHHTEEAKKKMREAKLRNPVRYWLGKRRSEETRRKVGESQKGRESPMKGKHHTAESRKKMSEVKKRRFKDPRNHPMFGRHHTEESRRKISETRKGRQLSQVTRRKLSRIRKELLKNPEIRRRLAAQVNEAGRKTRFKKGHRWEGETKDRMVKNARIAMRVRPTKPERELIEIIDKYGLPFKYVGDGKVVIAGRCPDFINCNGGKEIIEVFGDYWHSPLLNRSMRPNQGYEATIKAYGEYGFKTLILWENEISNESLVVHKINEFVGVV